MSRHHAHQERVTAALFFTGIHSVGRGIVWVGLSVRFAGEEKEPTQAPQAARYPAGSRQQRPQQRQFVGRHLPIGHHLPECFLHEAGILPGCTGHHARLSLLAAGVPQDIAQDIQVRQRPKPALVAKPRGGIVEIPTRLGCVVDFLSCRHRCAEKFDLRPSQPAAPAASGSSTGHTWPAHSGQNVCVTRLAVRAQAGLVPR